MPSIAAHNLGLDYLDICQPHGASEHDINDDLLLAMQRLRERGLIRHTGINTHSASTLHWMIANPDVFDGVLLDYNALQSAMASAPQVTDLHLSRPRLRQSGRHEKSHRRPHRFPADRHCVVVRRALHDHAWPVQGHRATRHRCTGTFVDFPRVRSSLRAQLNDYLVRQAGPDLAASPWGTLLYGLGNQLGGAAVDTLVTPIGIGALLQGHVLWKRGRNELQGGDPFGPTEPARPLKNAKHRFEALDRFVIDVERAPGEPPLKVVLEPQGLRWKVVDLQLEMSPAS